MTLDEMRARLTEVEARMTELHSEAGNDALSGDAAAEWDSLADEHRRLQDDIPAVERREEQRAQLARAASNPRAQEREVPNVNLSGTRDQYEVAERRDVGIRELRDAALKTIEERVEEPDMAASAEKIARRDTRGHLARHIVRFANPAYERAWAKYAAGAEVTLTNEERAALQVGANTNGGFLVPTHLDPTILLTNDGTINPFRRVSRVVLLSQADGNVWNGVTSAGVTAGDTGGELVEAGDNSPTFGREGIPVWAAHAFVQASIEATQDIAGLASDITMLLGDARDRLDSNRYAVGNGTNAPRGLYTALLANTNVHVEVDTQGAFVANDVYKVRQALPPRFRPNARWIMELSTEDQIRQLGSTDDDFTVDMTAEGIPRLLGREILESSEVPQFAQVAEQTNPLLAYGDFSRFILVDKVGMSIEFIPHLFATNNNRPNGSRGWYARWRRGSDLVTDTAFRLLIDGSD